MDKRQCDLLRRIQIYDFAAIDLNLFLDTHPENEKALNDFNYVVRKSNELKEEYLKCYGPLTPDQGAVDGDEWKWIDDPWPWEVEC